MSTTAIGAGLMVHRSLRVGLCLLAALVSLPAAAARPVTVAVLEQELSARRNVSDEALAAILSEMALTERFPSDHLHRILSGLPGDRSREALTVLADMSTFLDPAADEIPSTLPPDETTQREVMARVVDYVAKMNHKLPNFFATRTTTRFEDWPKGLPTGTEVAARDIPPQLVGTAKSVVTYRNGQEVMTSSTAHARKKAPVYLGLYSWGEFGPMLARMLVDASRSTAAWSRWERDENSTVAVFRFSVPLDKSSYQVKFCCYPQGTFLIAIDRNSAYHGEIAVDPENGTVVSLRIIADLDQGDVGTVLGEAMAGMPLSRADTLIEYGPVEIGGKTYICPRRTVAISRARVTERFTGNARSKAVFPIIVESPPQTVARPHHVDHYELGPAKTYINDTSFTDYHVFRSESRIILDGSR